MFGNVINNNQILNLIQSGEIQIIPFDKKKLQTIHYPLDIKGIIRYLEDNVENTEYHLIKRNPFILKANEYVVVEIDEHIQLGNGLVGEFVLSSNLIEKGLSLICGKLDPEYGKKGEAIRFGLKNLLNKDIPIEKDLKLAYIKFYDLRALDNDRYKLSKEELQLWRKRVRRGLDDGVDYGSGDE